MLCVWWNHHRIIHFEFLNYNQTLNVDLYTQKLQCVHENLLRKTDALNRRDVALLHYKTRSHSVRIISISSNSVKPKFGPI